MLPSNFTAELGRSSGAQATLVTQLWHESVSRKLWFERLSHPSPGRQELSGCDRQKAPGADQFVATYFGGSTRWAAQSVGLWRGTRTTGLPL